MSKFMHVLETYFVLFLYFINQIFGVIIETVIFMEIEDLPK